MRGFYKRPFFAFILFLVTALAVSQEMSPGTKLFMQNEPSKAIPVLEAELRQSGANPDLYNYLGIAYSQVGNFQKSIEVYQKGLEVLGTNKKVLYYNQGNAYYKLQNFEKAADCYSMTIVADPDFSFSYLNRANSYLKLNRLDECMKDYETYLDLNPSDPQSENIRRLLDLLRGEKEFQIAEQKRREQEAERRREEEERLAKAREEQERLNAQKRA
ncbi:MAG: tetratricopeptide repeat protein, partial [Treponema sp.]|nr:tetratricopeptide repeat protein [Treponema sp.]